MEGHCEAVALIKAGPGMTWLDQPLLLAPTGERDGRGTRLHQPTEREREIAKIGKSVEIEKSKGKVLHRLAKWGGGCMCSGGQPEQAGLILLTIYWSRPPSSSHPDTATPGQLTALLVSRAQDIYFPKNPLCPFLQSSPAFVFGVEGAEQASYRGQDPAYWALRKANVKSQLNIYVSGGTGTGSNHWFFLKNSRCIKAFHNKKQTDFLFLFFADIWEGFKQKNQF